MPIEDSLLVILLLDLHLHQVAAYQYAIDAYMQHRSNLLKWGKYAMPCSAHHAMLCTPCLSMICSCVLVCTKLWPADLQHIPVQSHRRLPTPRRAIGRVEGREQRQPGPGLLCAG